MKHVGKRVYFHLGIHKPGTLMAMWDDGRGLVEKPGTNETGFANITLKPDDLLIYLGNDARSNVGKTYIRCMSRHGICWVFPNVVTVLVAAGEDADSEPTFLHMDSISNLALSL